VHLEYQHCIIKANCFASINKTAAVNTISAAVDDCKAVDYGFDVPSPPANVKPLPMFVQSMIVLATTFGSSGFVRRVEFLAVHINTAAV